MKRIILLALYVLVGAPGCEEQAQTPAAPAAPVPAAPASAAKSTPQPPVVEPEYTLAIEVSAMEPKQYSVTWTARVNTSGWTMKTEQALVEDSMGATTARLWVILEQPNPGDAVTQGFETLTGRHDTGARKIDKAELSIKRTVLGVTPDFAPLYVIVKQTGG